MCIRDSEWVDYPNSSSTFPSETRVQVSSFVTGAYCGGSISDASKEGNIGHGIMANSFYDPILGFDGPLDTSDMAKMEEAKGIYGSLQKTPSLGELLEKENKNYAVITTGKIGNARLLNLNADELQQRLFSIWGADISSERADYHGIIEKFGPVPKQSFPNNKVSQYATQILLDHFLLDRSVDVQDLGIDFLCVSGHKMLGPTGIGVVWGRKELWDSMDPVYGGGDMIEEVFYDKATWAPVPHKFEAGTPPFVEAIGLGAAVDYLTNISMNEVQQHSDSLREYAKNNYKSVDDYQ